MVKFTKTPKMLFYGLVVVIFIGAIAGRIYQVTSENRDLELYPAPGELIDVNGHLMHINCLGSGSPTVILEQGLGTGGGATLWQSLHEKASKITRVCAYDRAGFGYSAPVDIPTRSSDVAANLHKLLQNYGLEDDLVLMGWSRGGVHVRAFEKLFPERVKGMVLVDSSHELQYERVPLAPVQTTNGTILYQVAQYLQPLGLWRITGLVDAQIEGFAIPEQEKSRARALYNMSHSITTLLNEIVGSEIDSDEAEAPSPLDDLPLIVITQGEPVILPEGLPPAYTLEYFEALRRVWNDLQRELTNLSTNSMQIIATESGHGNIHDKQPELIIEAISDIVLAIRSNSKLNTL
jgi:pimeloyl-ACP methyl ester carboxylesterase